MSVPPVIPPVSKVSDKVIRILGLNPGPMTLQGTNTYLIGTGKYRILLDTGGGETDYLDLLINTLNENSCQIQQIICTHWHHDHVGGIDNIQKVYPGVAVAKFHSDKDNLHSNTNFTNIVDTEKISVEGATIRAIFTPGHTDDHLSFLLEEENALFTGDCVLGEGTSAFQELGQYMKSLESLLTFEPKRIYPGHGNIIEEPVKAITSYINHRKTREKQIIEKLAQTPEPLSAVQLVDEIYEGLSEVTKKAAAHNVYQHLQKLNLEDKLELYTTDENTSPYELKWSLKSSRL